MIISVNIYTEFYFNFNTDVISQSLPHQTNEFDSDIGLPCLAKIR